MTDYLIIIQARLGSTRLPNKVMQMIGNKTMLRHVWDAAKATGHKTIVAWPERYPDLDETNVLERFRRISLEFPSTYIVRLTSDCPLITSADIVFGMMAFCASDKDYYSNHDDGRDVQVFTRDYLFESRWTHREHVINDFSTKPNGLSVNTMEDLNRVRAIINAR